MGRRPKDKSKGAPLDSKLTPKQFELLASLLFRSYQGDEHVGFTWSPKKLLGRSPTRGESSSLSARLRTLTEQGFVKRYGRDLFVTEQGKARLREDAIAGAEVGDLMSLGVLAFVEALAAKSQKETLGTAMDIVSKEPEEALPEEEKSRVIKALMAVATSKQKREIEAREIFNSVLEEYKNQHRKEF